MIPSSAVRLPPVLPFAGVVCADAGTRSVARRSASAHAGPIRAVLGAGGSHLPSTLAPLQADLSGHRKTATLPSSCTWLPCQLRPAWLLADRQFHDGGSAPVGADPARYGRLGRDSRQDVAITRLASSSLLELRRSRRVRRPRGVILFRGHPVELIILLV